MKSSRKPKLLLSVLMVLSCCSLSASFVNSGLITVVPVDEYVVTGSNFTIFCTINRTLTSDTSANLVWSKGYPPFTNFGSSNPSSGPNNITKIINETTMSITLLNMQPIHTAYYHCYLRGAQDLKDTDNCDIHVIDHPVALQHLTCGAFNVYSFYCSWERNYTAEYNATYSGAVDSFDNIGTRLMRDCENLPTPGVPEGYMKMCGDWRQHYEVRVSVKVSNPVGSSTTETAFNLYNEVKPLPVDNLIATSITASSAHLSGGPPPYYVETPSDLNTLNEYEISFTITGDEDWQTVTIGNDLSHTLVGLFPNTYYEVRVRSKPFVDNWSDWSDKTVFKTRGSIPTGSVTEVISEEGEQHSNKYSRTVTISWTGLTNHQEGADNFFYYVDLYDKQMQQVIRSDKTSHIAYTFPSISNFVSYDITVTPGNDLGNATATTITVANKTGVPGMPKDLQWHPYNSTAGTFSWDDPDEPNGIIEKFKVEWWKKYQHGPKSQSHSGEVTKTIGEDHFSFTVTGLETFEDYIFSVCAVRAGRAACGDEARVEGLTLQGAPVNPPAGFSISPEPSGDALSMQWRQPPGDHNGNIVRYVIRYCHQEQMDQNCLSEQDSVKYFNCTLHSADELIKCTLGGLRPYTYYQLAIAAVAGEVGPYSIPKVAKTAQSTAGPPGNLIVSSVNSSFILAAWDAPLNMNGALDQYQVTCTLCKTSSVSVYGTTALLEVYGDTDVEVSVRACTQAAIRACGNHVGPHKYHTPISSASHPMNIAIPEVHDDKVVLTWDAPEHPNGPIKFYRVRYRKSSSNRWENYNTFQNKSATVHVDCGMGSENVYDFSVIAVTQNDTVLYDSEPAQVKGQELCVALTTWNTFALISLASVALLVLVVSIIVFIMYHQRVKKNLPDPYFIDSVKSSIYGQKTWTYNESQFFIIERESFDTLRCVDDSTQLLGLDRMYSTEGSTSSSDQGIHDMDGQQLTAARSCTRLVPEGKGEEEKADYKRPLRVLCQDLDKDQDFAGDDAVFPDDTDNYGPTDTVTASVSYASPARSSTPPNSPASLTARNHSSERIDSGTASCCSEPTKYAKLTGGPQLSPSSTAADDSSRPLSSASEDSMSYTRIGENNNNQISPNLENNPKSSQRDLPRVVFSTPVTPNIDPKGHVGDPLATAGGVSPDSQNDRSSRGSPHKSPPPASSGNPRPRHHSSDSSSDELSGYCKQDMPGLVDAVTSSGVSSLGEEYSRIADGDAAQASGPAVVPQAAFPVDDPYITDQQMHEKESQFESCESPVPLEDLSPTSTPYTSPYVTSEHAV